MHQCRRDSFQTLVSKNQEQNDPGIVMGTVFRNELVWLTKSLALGSTIVYRGQLIKVERGCFAIYAAG